MCAIVASSSCKLCDVEQVAERDRIYKSRRKFTNRLYNLGGTKEIEGEIED